MKPSKEQKAIDERIERAYYRTCSDVQIDITQIGEVFKAGHAALAAGADETQLEAAILASVATLRENQPDPLPPLFTNYYVHCQTVWRDTWSAMCDDECPQCKKDIQPFMSDDGDDRILHVGPEFIPENGWPEGIKNLEELKARA